MAPSDDGGQTTDDGFLYQSSVVRPRSSGLLVILAVADDVGDVVLLFLLRHDEGAIVHRLFFDFHVLIAFDGGWLGALRLLVRLFQRNELGLGHFRRRRFLFGD